MVFTFPNAFHTTLDLILTMGSTKVSALPLTQQCTVSLKAEALRDSPKVSQVKVRHSGGRTQAPDISGDCVVWWKVLADGGWGGRNQAPKLTNSGKKTPGFQKGGLKAASCSSPTTQTSRYFSLFHFFYLQASWIICSLPLPLMMLITPDQSTSLPFLLVLQSKYPVPLTLSQKFVRMETIL